MVLLHGDHAVARIRSGDFKVAMLGSHEVGSPYTILDKGWACDLYNFWMIDVWGDSGRAE